MYKQNKMLKTSLTGITATKGESIEQKLRRILSNKEPIKDSVPLIYTDRAEGVRPEFDPRTDRFDLAIDAMDIHQKIGMAKREERQNLGKIAKENMDKEGGNNEAGGQSTSGTDSK